ncbi:MAG: endonuclease domain-containing protein [Candidatus Peregrinibacteria bacterium]
MCRESVPQKKRRKLLYALKLRRRMTTAERMLWNALRRKQPMGLKFRRQVPLSWYVVDFLCVEKNLIIELDGGVHAKQRSYDREREEELRRLGYRIIRFPNDQVLRALPEVINAILRKCSTPRG